MTGAILISGFKSPIPQSGLAAAAAAEEAAAAKQTDHGLRITAQSNTVFSNHEQDKLSLEGARSSFVGGGVATPMQDRVVLLGRLGEGATGVVFRAFDLLDLRLVAVKVIPVHDQCKRRQLVHELSSLFDGLKARRRTKSTDLRSSHSSTLAAASPKNHSWASREANRNSIRDKMPGSENVLDFIDAFVSKEAATLSLVVEYMDGGSLQVLFKTLGESRFRWFGRTS